MLKFSKEVPCEGLTIYSSTNPQRLRPFTISRLLLAVAMSAIAASLHIFGVVSQAAAVSLTMALLSLAALALLSAVHTEKVTILADFGVQIERLRLLGPTSRLLIEKSTVDCVFIHEAMRYVGAHFFLALRVRWSSCILPASTNCNTLGRCAAPPSSCPCSTTSFPRCPTSWPCSTTYSRWSAGAYSTDGPRTRGLPLFSTHLTTRDECQFFWRSMQRVRYHARAKPQLHT